MTLLILYLSLKMTVALLTASQEQQSHCPKLTLPSAVTDWDTLPLGVPQCVPVCDCWRQSQFTLNNLDCPFTGKLKLQQHNTTSSS